MRDGYRRRRAPTVARELRVSTVHSHPRGITAVQLHVLLLFREGICSSNLASAHAKEQGVHARQANDSLELLPLNLLLERHDFRPQPLNLPRVALPPLLVLRACQLRRRLRGLGSAAQLQRQGAATRGRTLGAGRQQPAAGWREADDLGNRCKVDSGKEEREY